MKMSPYEDAWRSFQIKSKQQFSIRYQFETRSPTVANRHLASSLTTIMKFLLLTTLAGFAMAANLRDCQLRFMECMGNAAAETRQKLRDQRSRQITVCNDLQQTVNVLYETHGLSQLSGCLRRTLATLPLAIFRSSHSQGLLQRQAEAVEESARRQRGLVPGRQGLSNERASRSGKIGASAS